MAVQTTLTAALNATDVTLTIASAADFPLPQFPVWIDAERFLILAGPPDSTTWTLLRDAVSTTQIGYDDFNRDEPTRWGTAPLGGNWNRAGSVTSVSGGMGRISLAAGTNENPRLSDTIAADAGVRFRFQADKLAVGDILFVYPVVRSVGASATPETFYRAQIKLNTDQTVQLRLEKVVADTPTTLVADAATGLTHAVDTPLWVALEAFGFSPTNVRARMWADGTDEPTSWLVSTTDSEATLQVEGRTGVRARTGASISNGPVLFSFGQFEAYEIPAGVTHSNGATVTLIDSEWVAGLMRVGDGAPDEYGEDGALWLDRTNSRLYAMNSGTWKYAALT